MMKFNEEIILRKKGNNTSQEASLGIEEQKNSRQA